MRCFVGLALPDRARAAIAEAERSLGGTLPGVSWQGPDRLHLTLAFLGEIAGGGQEAVLRAAEEALASFRLTGEGPAVFIPGRLAYLPGSRRPGVLALMAAGRDAPLEVLRAALCAALAKAPAQAGRSLADADWPDADRAGSRPRRPFLPHLSLARLRPSFVPFDLHEDRASRAAEVLSASGPWTFVGLGIYESRLGASGASYRLLESLPLDRAGGT